MVPFRTKVEQVKQAAISITRIMMVRERRSERRFASLAGAAGPTWRMELVITR